MIWVTVLSRALTPFLLAALLCATRSVTADDQKVVEVQDEPRHHVTFENAYVRILEVELAPGDTSLYHRHRRTNVAVVMDNGARSVQVLGGEMTAAAPATRGELLMARAEGEGYVHRVRNAGTAPLGFTDIEFLKPPGQSTGAAGLAVKPSSENDFYRAYQLTLAPGETSPALQLRPGVRVVLEGSKLQRIDDKGVASVIESAQHRWQWHEAGSYRVRNSGSSSAQLVEIELK